MKRWIAWLMTVATLLSAMLTVGAETAQRCAVTVNGQALTLAAGTTLGEGLAASGRQLVYAEVTKASGEAVTVTDPAYVPEDGDTVRAVGLAIEMESDAEVRQVLPSGVRFLTRVSLSDLADLQADEQIQSVSFGTLIRPFDTLEEGEALTRSEGEVCLDVKVSAEHPYRTSATELFLAGSVVSVKEQNHSRRFAGRGYAEVTLTNGQTVTVYASGTLPVGAYGVLAAELLGDETVTLTDPAKEFFKDVATTMYKTDLEGLGVLAIGDSLFDGDFLRGHEQWIGILSRACDWDFTNLGHDGWTVAYNPEAYEDPTKVRQSMYDNLFNNPDYRYGKDGSYTRGDPYGKEGDAVDVILMEGGTNDFGWGIPLGEVDSRDGGTLLGAWNLMIEKLLVDYPNATIILVTSWHREGTRASDGASRMDFVADGMKAIYEAHYKDNERIKLIDAGDPELTGIKMAREMFRYQYSKSTKDYNHLNAEGMKMMADAMLPLLWETLCKVR